MSNIHLISIAGDEHKRIAEVAWPIIEKYCNQIGATSELITEKWTSRNWSWTKIIAVENALRNNDGVEKIIWCDIDCLPISVGVPGPNFLSRLWTSSDNNGACCGFFVLPNFGTMDKLFSAWWILGQMDNPTSVDSKDNWEQSTLKHLLANYSNVRDLVELISQKEVSNPETRGLTELPIFHHFWANMGVNRTIKSIKECLDDPVKYLKKQGVMA